MPSRRSLRAPSLDDGLWSRRLLSLTVAAGVAAAVAVPLLRVPRFDVDGAACGIWLMIGAQQLARRWWPRRDARLTWRLRVAGRAGVEPGLVARRVFAALSAALVIYGTTLAIAITLGVWFRRRH